MPATWACWRAAIFSASPLTQLPLGRWLDRHGPKRVILSFMLLAVAGCLAFSVATSFWGLLAARVLCGIGVSACLMAPLTGFRRWLTPTAQLRANSWMLMTGSLGMLASTLPVQWLMPVIGWRPLFWMLAGGGGAVDGGDRLEGAGWRARARGTGASKPGSYAEVWRHPYFRRVAPVGFFHYGGTDRDADPVGRALDGPGGRLRAAAGRDGLFLINMCDAGHLPGLGHGHALAHAQGADHRPPDHAGRAVELVVLAFIIVAGPAAGAAPGRCSA